MKNEKGERKMKIRMKKTIAGSMVLALLCASMSGTNVAQAADRSVQSISKRIVSIAKSGKGAPNVAAEKTGTEQVKAKFVLTKDKKTVIEVANKQTATYAVIPKSIEKIGKEAFLGCRNLKSVTVPKSVKSVGENAFADCYMTKKNISNSSRCKLTKHGLTIIDREKDGFCIKGNKLVSFRYRDLDNVTKVSIPEGVVRIGEYACNRCKYLEDITIPTSVQYIEYGAFSDCSRLGQIEIPTSVKSIGQGAFFCCDSLRSIVLPNSVTYIDEGAFAGCCMVVENVHNDSKFDLSDAGLFIVDREEDGFCFKGNELVKYRYKKFDNVTSITIPEGVTSIANGAFAECKSLKSVTIPNGVTSIGGEILMGAFYNCTSLERITIPESVESIGANAFLGCYMRIEDISNSSRCKLTDCGLTIIDSDKDGLCIRGNELVKYRYGNFDNVTSITIPEGVTSIGEEAFWQCYNLKNIILPKGVESIGNNAFAGCTSLEKINIPKGVKRIGDNAFAGCHSLEKINIPKGVESIGNNAFAGCTSLKK